MNGEPLSLIVEKEPAKTDEARGTLRENAVTQNAAYLEIKPDYDAVYTCLSSQYIWLHHRAESPKPVLRYLADAEKIMNRQAALMGQPVHEFYNDACVLGLRGHREDTLASLEPCLAEKTITADHVADDPDWQGFATDAAFLALENKYR